MATIQDNDVYIVSAVRTPIGKFLGSLAGFSATDLGGFAVKAALERAKVPGKEVDEVFMGNVLQAGVGQAPARQAAIKGGVPDDVPAMTVNMVCGSGLRAVMLAASEITAGQSELLVAGGMESMSNSPFLLPQARTGLRLGNGQVIDSMVHDGLWCAFENWHMGSAAEHIAREFKITRQMQDEYAAESQNKAVAAIEGGKFKKEIAPVQIPQRKGDPIMFDTDESPRKGTTVESLAGLRPAFEKDGTVTAGNAPSINDGASATVVASGKKVKELGLTPMAKITGYATGSTSPKMIFYAPVYAVRNLMEKTGRKIGDYDLIEANEAFAAQSLVDGNELGWDWSRANVNGGAIALGHPIGASGARVLTTLLYALEDRGKTHGLATLCLGGGNAVALSVERV
ncbi:MAG: acetyl-CoA C-acetyltransferase [Candidatus Eisenbacteria bacterium]|uniref:Acetyl-CoA C-acetyltransferase n=1 Tax=Eiseniibacteriota bacterium TaxID=2212470 RepID=A0A956NB17_UNCEI|nr:acetyl-CoA C-acetyltransferase [Candidatus Eisenbacteria bacterium]MCB9464861.1 acetyl-CoA C-acetyltransferase [Candidatus Eisenbacteria bacterium]